MTKPMTLPALVSLLTLSICYLSSLTSAFEVQSPSEKNYWVTNHTNVLSWTYNDTDAQEFSVQLLNSNQSSLIGNFQIGNSLTTANRSAVIQLDAIPTGQYTLLLVNSSNYELDHPQVFYSTQSFEIKPNGTQPAEISQEAESTATSAGAGPDATISASGSQSTGNNSNNSKTDGTNSATANAFATGSLLVASIVMATIFTL